MPSRLNWCQQQQNLLRILKQEQNISSWKKIATILKQKFLDSSRSGKQCRDRYINYVRFNSECPKIVGWSPEQDKILFQKFQQFGAKWVQISSQMPGRSQNNLKNRFYGAIRKIMRKIAKVEKDMKPKPKKTIKQRQLIKIFQDCRVSDEHQTSQNNQKDFVQFSKNLYNRLIILAISQEEQICMDDIKVAIQMIHEFNNNSSRSALKIKQGSESSTCQDIQKQNTQDQISNQQQMKDVSYWEQNNEAKQNQINNDLKLSGLLSWQQPAGNCPSFICNGFQNFWSLESEIEINFNETSENNKLNL